MYSNVNDRNPGDMIGNDVYEYLISDDGNVPADTTLPISMTWHVAFP